jgi:hypothetical protein
VFLGVRSHVTEAKWRVFVLLECAQSYIVQSASELVTHRSHGLDGVALPLVAVHKSVDVRLVPGFAQLVFRIVV